MSNLSDFLGGSKPKLITPYTTSTGTYTPTVDMARCFVRVQAGGGGGWAAAGNAGGGGGAMVEAWIRVPIAGIAYVVGGGGAVSVSGSPSTLGQLKANGGTTPQASTYPGWGGLVGLVHGNTNTAAIILTSASSLGGVVGGGGGNASKSGQLVGYPGLENATSDYIVNPAATAFASSNGVGNSSGGNSFYGKGNPNNTAPTATAYGAGGGANAAGSGGYIEIWDFGA